MLRHLPIILTVVAIIGLTLIEIRMSDRFRGSDMTEEEFAALLQRVPKEIGDWQGEDQTVEEQVRQTSGARGYVSRAYRNVVTGDRVTLWLIVGHARDVCRHTPDVCYPSSGFKMRSEHNALHPFIFEGQPRADFYTNTFVKEDTTGRQLVRVFWSWYKPSEDGEVLWEAPKNVRWNFGNARSLYKMYFSSEMRDLRETTEQSPCLQFAEVFLPVVDRALSSVESDEPMAELASAS